MEPKEVAKRALEALAKHKGESRRVPANPGESTMSLDTFAERIIQPAFDQLEESMAEDISAVLDKIVRSDYDALMAMPGVPSITFEVYRGMVSALILSTIQAGLQIDTDKETKH